MHAQHGTGCKSADTIHRCMPERMHAGVQALESGVSVICAFSRGEQGKAAREARRPDQIKHTGITCQKNPFVFLLLPDPSHCRYYP